MKRQVFDEGRLATPDDVRAKPSNRGDVDNLEASLDPHGIDIARSRAVALLMLEFLHDLESMPAEKSLKDERIVSGRPAAGLRDDRLHRARFFPPELFGEPAWDILLDLFAALHRGENRTIKEACLAANVPEATALRYIEILIRNGLLSRRRDREDNRRKFLSLTPDGNRRMIAYFRLIRPPGDSLGRLARKLHEPR